MPGTVKRIVCLANSIKHSGRCIAGKEYVNRTVGEWVRPVSSREGEEVSEHERQYENGTDPKLLDIVEVPIIKAKPKTYQSENWLLDPDLYWAKRGRIGWADLPAFVDTPTILWNNGHKTYHGKNDYVPADDADNLSCSLYMIQVERMDVDVFLPGEAFGDTRRKVQGNFVYNGTEYGLSITDPVAKRHFLDQGLGEYTVGKCYLTVSLGERHKDDRCYKMIAGGVTEKRANDAHR